MINGTCLPIRRPLPWPIRTIRTRMALLLIAAALLGGCDNSQPYRPQLPRVTPDGSTSIMPVDEVRIGMRGYGMTVFAGTKIEPFPVEVVSIMHDFDPRLAVIWIRCPDERMQKSGPVQGMSGSPIYLWDANEEQRPGYGGRLIGAFAFGFSLSKDCYVGVQPIEQMRDAANRALTTTQPASAPSATPADRAAPMIQRLLAAAAQQGVSPANTWQARMIQSLTQSAAASSQADPDGSAMPMMPGPFGEPQRVQRLMLPINVGSQGIALAVAPLLEPSGLTPLAVEGLTAGKAPAGVDIDAIKLQAGSVLALPLAWGDADLSAAGTVTEVLPDGRVLGFGHAMDGQGPTALPMATGFVHMVMPMISTSFKLGGSGNIHGALVRDENVGVIGTPTGKFTSAPIRITVNHPGQPQREYDYRVAHHKRLTPILAAIVSLQSLNAHQNPPVESTLKMSGVVKFSKGHDLTIDSLQPDAGSFSVLGLVLPVVATMSMNDHDSLMLESMDLKLDVEEGRRVGTIATAFLDRAEVAPGDTLRITVNIQPHGQSVQPHRVEMRIPHTLKDGQYPLMISDAQTYAQILMNSRPHLATTSSIGELQAIIQRLLSIRNDALYLTLQLPEEGIAVGQHELSALPSSRKALIASPVSTLATPYRETLSQVVPLDRIIIGQKQFVITVNRELLAP